MTVDLRTKTATARGPRRIPGEAGIWVFILGDLFIFALFFVTFVVDRSQETALFDASRAELHISWGALNTLLLLTGSLFVVWSVHAARDGKLPEASRFTTWAMGCGVLFGINKVVEYTDKISSGHGPDSNIFFTYYFCFTGLHALHLLVALCVLGRMRWLLAQPDFDQQDMGTLESAATYWHLVDLLWIVLFALLYLMT
ncbi:cytochrome c oxidase subunit 3 [Nocardioides sp. WS12]|uniref:cytochrome c oxidase subunit 3 n=1 Tax=Nocardioides sp. WS12 TaxID=2486272 RepID=UPI00191D8515|nr:cytochrome c oxidase subunit 3 [Nocardioides sp. WS12]